MLSQHTEGVDVKWEPNTFTQKEVGAWQIVEWKERL